MKPIEEVARLLWQLSLDVEKQARGNMQTAAREPPSGRNVKDARLAAFEMRVSELSTDERSTLGQMLRKMRVVLSLQPDSPLGPPEAPDE